jgi:phosphatidylserine decarboxylase
MLILLENAQFELIVLILLTFFKIISMKLFIIILCGLIFFFRNPYIQKSNGIVSPTFGKLMNIEETKQDITFQIFLNIFDPHIQYSPVDGKIIKQTYISGSFHPAYLMTKSKYNERQSTIIQTQDQYNKKHNIEIIQYGGMVVRRIVSFVKPNDNVQKTQMLGMIKFSSRVDITIPKTLYTRVVVTNGQKIKAGEPLVL